LAPSLFIFCEVKKEMAKAGNWTKKEDKIVEDILLSGKSFRIKDVAERTGFSRHTVRKRLGYAATALGMMIENMYAKDEDAELIACKGTNMYNNSGGYKREEDDKSLVKYMFLCRLKHDEEPVWLSAQGKDEASARRVLKSMMKGVSEIVQVKKASEYTSMGTGKVMSSWKNVSPNSLNSMMGKSGR
jgi:hypothetical protein